MIDGRFRELIEQVVVDVLSRLSKPTNDAYLSTTEAARIASVTPATIRRWVRQKKLKRHEAGGRVRVKRDELERLMTPAGKETAAERAKRRFGT